MTGRFTPNFEMFLKAREFFLQHAADFPDESIAATLIAAFLAIVAHLETLDARKVSHTGTAAQEADTTADARLILEDKLEDIAGISKSLAYEIDGLEEKFRMPKRRGKQSLIAAGHAFAADALPFKEQFIKSGMPATFIDDLNDAVDALEQSRAAATAATTTRVGTNSEFEPLIKDGLIKIHRLDPIVRMKYRGDAANFAAWIYASHVERLPKKNTKSDAPTPVPHG